MCICTGVWCSTVEIMLTSSQLSLLAGALGTCVKPFYILLSALNVLFFVSIFCDNTVLTGCSHPNRLI